MVPVEVPVAQVRRDIMPALSPMIRATVLVVGIAALGVFVDRAVAGSGLAHALLMRQQSIPGALYLLSAVNALTYAVAVLVVAALVARGYWRALFPAQLNLMGLAACLVLGMAFAAFLNNPVHQLLFNIIFGKPVMTGGMISDVVAGNLFSNLRMTNLFTLAAFATVVATPFIEELTDRGILFKEAEGAPLWQLMLLSLAVFALSHFMIGGMAKVLAVVPAGLLFVGLRAYTGSFVYAAAAHMGVNLAALLKLQVF
jgi:membrane protease YdiL (CAAX protease family)